MLGASNVIATVAVKDIEAASKYYEGTLGLSRAPYENPDPTSVIYTSGSTAVLVYQSGFAGTNQATYASWGVGDEFDSVVDELKSKGVSFEQYDMPGVTREGDVHLMGDMKAVWFKDPDGNVLSIVNQSM